MKTTRIELIALPGLPLVRPGDDLVGLIEAGLAAAGLTLVNGDVLVIAQKIVSKAAGRFVDLATVEPSARALELAAVTGKEPRQVELILRESVDVVAHRPGVLIVENRLGLVMANAGIDASNVGGEGPDTVLLLPEDPDGECRRLRAVLGERRGAEIAVVINDSIGRAWRQGTVGLAIGSAGLPALWDLRGNADLFGRKLEVSQQAIADELAAAASLVQGQGGEGQPVVLVRGLRYPASDQGARALLRPREEDLFR